MFVTGLALECYSMGPSNPKKQGCKRLWKLRQVRTTVGYHFVSNYAFFPTGPPVNWSHYDQKEDMVYYSTRDLSLFTSATTKSVLGLRCQL